MNEDCVKQEAVAYLDGVCTAVVLLCNDGSGGPVCL